MTAMSTTGEVYALLIGVNDYGKTMRKLDYAVADVLALREFLGERMGMKPNNCRTMTFPDTGSGIVPRRNDLLGELEGFCKARMGPEDTFVLYFAGHGFGRGDASYLLAVDSDPGSSDLLDETAVSWKTLRKFLSRVGAGQQLVILDACRNEPSALGRGAATAGMDAVMTRDIVTLAQDVVREDQGEKRLPRARAVLSACGQGQVSYEYPKGRQGWFCHNLLGVLREHPGGEMEVNELSERVRRRMEDSAWRELREAAGQEPYLEFQGRPLRLRMRPLSPGLQRFAPSPDDPAQVQVKEITVAPLDVKVERVGAAQVAVAGLPPIPGDILELEGVLAGLEGAIALLNDQTHASLLPGLAAIRDGEEQWERLNEDLHSHQIALPSDRKDLLAAEVSRDPRGSLARLCKMVPEVPPGQLLPYIHRLRNAELARRSVESARKQYEAARVKKIAELETEAEEVHTKLLARQQEDLQAVLASFLGSAVVGGEFPVEAWLEFEPLLLRRRYALTPLELLEKAEHCLQRWESERARLLGEARQKLAEQEYGDVVKLLQQLPSAFRSEDVGYLIEEAEIAIARLMAEIRQAVAEKRYEGLLAKVNRYRELRPDDGKVVRLAEQLREWEEREQKKARRAPTNSIGMRLVLIEPGEFMMGSKESAEELARAFAAYGQPKAEYFKDEYPRHRVQITREFYLAAYQVTVGQFRTFVEDSAYKTDAEKDGKGGRGYGTDGKFAQKPEYTWRNPGFEQTDEHPVVNVSWNDAVAFCQWLSRKEGKTYRLPTEAEWEYACRAGTETRYYNGDDPERLVEVGNVADGTAKEKFPDWTTISAKDGYVFTAPVGQFKSNTWGLYDMHGNVWEWCADWYGADYYEKSPTNDPPGPSSGASRVLRGGSWDVRPFNARSAYRYGDAPDNRISNYGFRVARTA